MNRMVYLLMIPVLACAAGCDEAVDDDFTGTGTIEATEVTISPEIGGRLTRVAFDEGDTVSAGDTLAVIDVEDIRLQREVAATGLKEVDWNERTTRAELKAAGSSVSQAEVSRDIARTTHDRIAGLLEKGAATQDRFDRTAAELSIAESRLEAARDNLAVLSTRLGSFEAAREKLRATLDELDHRIAKGVVTNPATGTVIEKFMEEGELARMGAPLCTVADLSRMELMVYIGEEMLGKVSLGSTARVKVDSHPDRDFTGTVTWISPRAEFTPKNVQTRDSRVDLVYAVKISLGNNEGILKIGMPADAYIEGLADE